MPLLVMLGSKACKLYQVSVGPVVIRTGFGRTDPCSNLRNTLRRGMKPNHPKLGLDPDVARRVNRMQTQKKKACKLCNHIM